MLKIFKNKKAQNTAEYAILIALVVGGVIAMQTYAQRALQGRIRDAAVALRDQTSGMATGNKAMTLQYEPYYTNTADVTETTSEEQQTSEQQWKNVDTTKDKSSVDRTEYKANLVTYGNEDENEAGL